MMQINTKEVNYVKNSVALYCRVDSGGAPKDLKLAASLQKTKLERYAKKYNLYVVACYEDIGFTGNDFFRPGLNAMLTDCAKGLFETVLVVNRSRLFRGNFKSQSTCPFKVISLDDLNRQPVL